MGSSHASNRELTFAPAIPLDYLTLQDLQLRTDRTRPGNVGQRDLHRSVWSHELANGLEQGNGDVLRQPSRTASESCCGGGGGCRGQDRDPDDGRCDDLDDPQHSGDRANLPVLERVGVTSIPVTPNRPGPQVRGSAASTPRKADASHVADTDNGSARPHNAAPPNARPARAAVAQGEPARAATQPQTPRPGQNRTAPEDGICSCETADNARTTSARTVTTTAAPSCRRSPAASTTRAPSTVAARELARTAWTW